MELTLHLIVQLDWQVKKINKMSKTNTEKLKEAQGIINEINKTKEEIELLLKIIDDLEIKYYDLVKEIKENK